MRTFITTCIAVAIALVAYAGAITISIELRRHFQPECPTLCPGAHE